MKFLYALLVGVLSAATGFAANAADWSIEVVSLPGGVAALFEDQGRTVVRTRSDAFFRLGLSESGALQASRLGNYEPPKRLRRSDMLPDGLVSVGSGHIAEAYLIGPTSRYRHGVMGDAIEAGGLRVLTRDGVTLDFRLPPDSVFEDLLPRLHDVDGDGDEEIVVVRSYLESGAAVAVFDVRNGELIHIAETESIGRSNRWLNPVGVADFDGDGQPEIAVVKTPHIGGILELYQIEDGTVAIDLSARGYSNHFIGSRDLFLSRIADIDRDGVPDIVVPSADRSTLRFVGMVGGKIKDLGTAELPARVQTNMLPIDPESGTFVFGLADGALAVVHLGQASTP
jgi:hypothetical protein